MQQSNDWPSGERGFTAVDLFCGAGGLGRGLREAGFSLLAAADHDPDGCATYRANHPGTPIVEGDLTASRNRDALLELANHQRVDLLAGGPPCQAFSQIHNHDRLLEDPRNRLYREFVTLLETLRPRALLLENVPGMSQLAGGEVRRQIERDLSLGGRYRVQSGVLDAAAFGVPQRRRRLIFVGVDSELGAPRLPAGISISGQVQDAAADAGASLSAESVLLDPDDDRIVTASQAIGDLLRPGVEYFDPASSAYQRKMRAGSDAPQDHAPSRIRKDTVARLEAIPAGGNVHDLPEALLRRYLGDDKWGPAGDGKRLARRHFYAYRRLHPDRLAWTVNTKADFAYHYGPPRGLSVREAARLQGFPDAFHFLTAPPGTPGQYKNGSRHSRYRQVGNAVPPPLAQAIGEEIRAVLEGAARCELEAPVAA